MTRKTGWTVFQSTLSMRRATDHSRANHGGWDISIHALHEESDRDGIYKFCQLLISIHALHEESDRLRQFQHESLHVISIHALHEESDYLFDPMNRQYLFQSTLSMRRATMANSQQITSAEFQSTLSMRRATQGFVDALKLFAISIHALHEESDSRHFLRIRSSPHFNPRSP